MEQIMSDRYIVVDVETTGLDSHKHSVIEIGAIAFDDNEELTYPVEVARYTGKMGVDEYTTIDAEALQVNGRKFIEDVSNGDKELISLVWQGFAQWLIKYATPGCTIIGHNIQFDLDFLIKGADKAGIDLKRILGKNKVDTKQVATFLKDSGVINPDNLRLITLWNYFFLEDPKTGNKENPHNALQDAFMTSQIYFHMREIV